MSSSLGWVLRRASSLQSYQRDEAVDALGALILTKGHLRGNTALIDSCFQAFKNIAGKDRSLVPEAMARTRVDPNDPIHGAGVAFLATVIPQLGQPDERCWESVVKSAELGLGVGKWHSGDCRRLVHAVARWGVYPKRTFPAAVERYVTRSVAQVDQSDLANLSAMLTGLTETYGSPLVHSVAQRAIVLAGSLSPDTIGLLARQWVRAQYKNSDAVGALANQIGRIGSDLDLFQAVALFSLLVTHKEHCKKELLAILTIQIAERIEEADVETIVLLLKGMSSIADDARNLIDAEWAILLNSVSDQTKDLLRQAIKEKTKSDSKSLAEKEKEMKLKASSNSPQTTQPSPLAESVEVATMLITRYFALMSRRSTQQTLSAAVTECLHAFADFVTAAAEDFVSDENPPFSVINPLLAMEVEPKCVEAGVTLLRESALQDVPLPTLNIFRYILSLCEQGIADREINEYLRTSFIATCDHIPIVQLCTAMKCFAITENSLYGAENQGKLEAAGDEIDDDGKSSRDIFLDQIESVVRLHSGKDMRALLHLTRSYYHMWGRADSFYDMVACSMINLLPSSKCSTQSASAAEVCLQALKKQLASRPDLKAFLEKAKETGLKSEPATPSKWMQENDPSSVMEPLTPEQQKLREIVAEMKNARSSDANRLGGLTTEYVSMMKHIRVEEVHEFFFIFADKCYKNDKVLNDVLKFVISEKMVEKMSAYSVSSILQSLASIRFAYHVTAKNFLQQVTEEQWSAFDGASLSVAVAALGKLSIRITPVLNQIGERIISTAATLSPLDTAHLIGGLQSLGFHEDAVMKALIARAQDSAAEFSSGQIVYLLTCPQISRLLTDVGTATPLIQRALYFADHMSPNEKQKIANNLRRAALPRDLIASTASALEIGTTSPLASRAIAA
jgi:hypothetical protein